MIKLVQMLEVFIQWNKNGYILLNTLIPVQRDDMWAFYDKSGNKVSNGFKYKNIGCSSIKSANNIYPLLEIPEYNVVVVSDEDGKYAFMDTTGNDSILNFLFDEMYMLFQKESHHIDDIQRKRI